MQEEFKVFNFKFLKTWSVYIYRNYLWEILDKMYLLSELRFKC